ncbi:MAG: hypothetical protein VYA17_03840 [Pseudomonadota bacterium]|nr:hypothetical protein [Pseudomonadota bacterium]
MNADLQANEAFALTQTYALLPPVGCKECPLVAFGITEYSCEKGHCCEIAQKICGSPANVPGRER